MKHKQPISPKSKHPLVHTGEVGAIAGEVAGGIVGSAAGPVGAVAGMVLGGIAGAVAANVMKEESARASAHDAELDHDIGVFDGDLGAAPKNAPRSRLNAPSAASSGAGGGGHQPASGPIQDLDE